MKWLGLSVFDLDHTLVKGNSSFGFCLYLISKGALPFYSLFYALCYYIRHYFFGLSLEQLHKAIFKLVLKGRSLSLLEKYAESFVDFYLDKAINFSTLFRLRLAQHLGHYTLILSNSPSFLVSAFAKRLGVDGCGATRYGVDKNNRLSRIDFILQGEEKAECVNQIASSFQIPKEKVTAYSDSYLDLPFLLTAGTAVVVNPDRKLLKYSKSHAWTIL